MVDVEAIAREPHPIGSAEIARVRAYLLSRLESLDLKASLRPGLGITTYPRAPALALAGSVQNIVAQIEGSDPTLPAVLLMAHYDTVPNSPGAADDTAGVAVVLEIARAIISSGPHRRSVFLLLTDGEEPGLLGASAFFANDPLKERVGLVINLEARGDSGRATMFETSPDSGALVRLYARHVADPSADSFAAGLYRLMPNNTDLTPALSHGIAGLNFAFVDEQVAYHTGISTPEHLNAGSLQHMGEQALAMTRALLDEQTLPGKQTDLVYFDLFGAILIHYPIWFGWVLVALTALMLSFAIMRLRRDGTMSWRDIANGAQGFILLVATNVLALQLCAHVLQWLSRDDTSEHALLGNFNLLLTGCALVVAGTSALVIVAMARGAARSWLCGAAAVAGVLCNVNGIDPIGIGAAASAILLGWLSLRRAANRWGAWIGMAALGLVLMLTMQAIFPLGAHLVAWPVLIAAVAVLIVLVAGRSFSMLAPAVLISLLGALALGYSAAQAAGFFAAIGPSFPPVLAPFSVLALLVVLPLVLEGAAGKRVVLGSLIIACVGIALLTASGTLSSRTPRAVEAFYLANLESDRYFRASLLPHLDDWSHTTLSSDGEEPQRVDWQPWFSEPVWLARARPTSLRKPNVTIEKSRATGNRLIMHLCVGNAGRALRIWIRPAVDLANARIDAQPVSLRALAGQWAEIAYYAPGPEGVSLSFDAPPSGAVEVRVAETRDGWPEGLEPHRPPPTMMAWRRSDSTLILDRLTYSW